MDGYVVFFILLGVLVVTVIVLNIYKGIFNYSFIIMENTILWICFKILFFICWKF